MTKWMLTLMSLFLLSVLPSIASAEVQIDRVAFAGPGCPAGTQGSVRVNYNRQTQTLSVSFRDLRIRTAAAGTHPTGCRVQFRIRSTDRRLAIRDPRAFGTVNLPANALIGMRTTMFLATRALPYNIYREFRVPAMGRWLGIARGHSFLEPCGFRSDVTVDSGMTLINNTAAPANIATTGVSMRLEEVDCRSRSPVPTPPRTRLPTPRPI